MNDLFKNIIKDSALIYASTWKAIELLPSDKKRYKAIKALLDFQLYGKYEDIEEKDILIIITQAIPNINSAKIRYDKACRQGKYGIEGGRPIKINKNQVKNLKDEGYSNKQIADELGCTSDYISKILRERKTLNNKNNTNENYKDNIENNLDQNSNYNYTIEDEEEEIIDDFWEQVEANEKERAKKNDDKLHL